MDSTCCLVALNKKYELVLCLECDFYINREPGDSWQIYYRKICKHLTKDRRNNGLEPLSRCERLKIFGFLELQVGSPLSVTKPNTDLEIHFRQAVVSPREALHMKESHIVDAVLCGFDGCTFLVADTKNRLNRLKCHSKSCHNGFPIQQILVKAQEIRLNTYFLLGLSSEQVVLQSSDDIVYMVQSEERLPVPGEPEQLCLLEESRLPMLEILDSARKETDESYVGKWEKFFRIEISESILLNLFSGETSEIQTDTLQKLIDAWLKSCEDVWFRSIEPNYSLQQLLMKHFDEATFFQKSFRIQAVRRKGRYLLLGFLTFCINWMTAKGNGTLPEVWANLLPSASVSHLVRLAAEIKSDVIEPKTLDQFLDSIFKCRLPLKDANVFVHVISAYLIGWIFKDGMLHALKNLRNASQGAYAFENIIRLHSATRYVESGESSILDRVKLQVITLDGTFVHAMEFAHQVEFCFFWSQILNEDTGVYKNKGVLS